MPRQAIPSSTDSLCLPTPPCLLLSLLRRSAYRVTYSDALGNISSSHLRREQRPTPTRRGSAGAEPSDSASWPWLLQLRTRFPVFGGWKAAFDVGYTLPLMHSPPQPPEELQPSPASLSGVGVEGVALRDGSFLLCLEAPGLALPGVSTRD